MTLILLSAMTSIMFLFMSHPMTMGLILLVQTILVSLITGMLSMNFWFSYILFLIMIGGMLVLFIYMTSIASNEMFYYSSKMLMILLIFLTIIMISMLMMDYFFFSYNICYSENINLQKYNIFMMKFFNYPSIFIIFSMIIYLFITLIAIVKITKIEYGPLRQKF